MDSNSTLVPNPQSSSRNGDGCRVKGDHFAMATYDDNHSESEHCIAYPALPSPRLRIGSQMAALPEDEKEQRPGSSSLQEGDLFHDSLVRIGFEVTTSKSLGRSWIGDSAVASPTGASCHPAVSHGDAAQVGEANDAVYTAGGCSLQ